MAMKAVYILFSFGMAGFMFVILFMATIAKSCGLYQQLWMMAISAFSIVAAFRSAVQFKQIYNLVWQAAAGDNDEEKLWL